MRPEDLFLAIGSVEESRLARSEFFVSSADNEEETAMKKKPVRIIRNLLVAAVIVSMLAVTAYAVTGYLLYESPEEMIAAIFGNETGFDHKNVTQWSDPQKPGSVYNNPSFDRVAADATVAAEDIAPHVESVGQSVSGCGYTLKADAFLYDAATGCGFVTYLLENPAGHDYKLQENGEVWYDGKPNPVHVNQYGYHYIIQEKTTAECLAATFYFRNTGIFGENLVLSLPWEGETPSDEELNALILDLDRKTREKYTPEEAIKTAKDAIGEAVFEGGSGLPDGLEMTQAEWDAERAYTILRDLWYQQDYEQMGPSVTIPMVGSKLNHATAGEGSILISPISFRLDAANLKGTIPEIWHDDSANVNDLTICFRDGTEYVIHDSMEEYVDNSIFRLIDSASEGRRDLYNCYTCMFNRIIDVDSIVSVIVNGTELTLD